MAAFEVIIEGLFHPRFESNQRGCNLPVVDWHPETAGKQHDELIQAGDFSINSISRQIRDLGRGLATTHYRKQEATRVATTGEQTTIVSQ